MPQRTLLDHLRSRSYVDFDSFDAALAAGLGPFQDSTSNQAIAYFELREHKHLDDIRKSFELTEELIERKDATNAIDVAMVLLALRMLPNLKGITHIQVNPYHAHATQDMVANAEALIKYAHALQGDVDRSRFCIKVPATWEGLQACRIIESRGIKTLATIVFSREQLAIAGQMGCSYVAPYINELRVHFEPGFQDPEPGVNLIPWAQAYYKRHGHRTQVMPASLTSVKEVMALAGADHITVAPHLLQKLHDTIADENILDEYPSLFGEEVRSEELEPIIINDQSSFDAALGKGPSKRKLKEVRTSLNCECSFC